VVAGRRWRQPAVAPEPARGGSPPATSPTAPWPAPTHRPPPSPSSLAAGAHGDGRRRILSGRRSGTSGRRRALRRMEEAEDPAPASTGMGRRASTAARKTSSWGGSAVGGAGVASPARATPPCRRRPSLSLSSSPAVDSALGGGGHGSAMLLSAPHHRFPCSPRTLELARSARGIWCPCPGGDWWMS
jgi:hypothetical protein